MRLLAYENLKDEGWDISNFISKLEVDYKEKMFEAIWDTPLLKMWGSGSYFQQPLLLDYFERSSISEMIELVSKLTLNLP